MPSIVEKRFTIKVYAPDGTTLRKTLDPRLLRGTPSFTSRINGGFGECRIELHLPFDDFDEGTVVDFMNIVKIYESDAQNTSGRLIYTGFVSAYQPFVKGSDQGVTIVLLGLVSLLALAYYKNGASFTVTHSAVDPSAIMKLIIDHFATVNTKGLIGYNGSGTTVDLTGTTVSYTFTDQKWLDALTAIAKTAPAGWWWSIDATGQLYFKNKPASATHTFTIGKDIDELIVDKSSEGIVNATQVRYSGGGTSDASDGTSITNFERRESIIDDQRITIAGTAAARAAAEIANFKDEKVKATLVVNSQYDIETIKVGDTCKIRNLSTASTTFTDNMQIVSVRYEWDRVTLELEDLTGKFAVELAKSVSLA